MKILSNYPLAKETTFHCGGKARWYVEVENLTEFENLLKMHRGDYYILGGGSKTLCVDGGYSGLVISTKKLNKIERDDNLIVCECGVNLFALHAYLAEKGFSGLEWSMGIPASVGGAVVMNAGSFDKDFSQNVKKVEIFEKGKRVILEKKDIEFAYRHSSLKGKNVFRVWLEFERADRDEVKSLQQFFFDKKNTTQPICAGSAGSIFKRHGDIIPAKIIDKMGLKGVILGGAEISPKHSGFIVNKGDATASDIIELIDLIKNKVDTELGIKLENEIIILE